MAGETSSAQPIGRRGSAASTRERILDIALELFTEQGYDKTSLRDIAERLGTTKAALYYHFAHKQDILLELHLRLHAFGNELLSEFAALPDDEARAAAWPTVLGRFIDKVADNHELLLLHQRNPTAIRALERNERHLAANADIEEQFRALLMSPLIPLATRVRMACSIGAVIAGMLGGSELLGEVDSGQLAGLVRAAVDDMFA
jgi:AcrR family transcriptional regulator